MNANDYAVWVRLWREEHPEIKPPTEQQFLDMCEMFDLTREDIGLTEEGR